MESLEAGQVGAIRVQQIGEQYLTLLGQTFPVMTASENFYTFPRAHVALEHPHQLETLSEASITATLGTVETLLQQLTRIDPTTLDLESRIDWHLVWGSMRTFLRDFGRRRVWQTDPVLYLKIVNLCCELNAADRLPQVPALLVEARRNLRQVPRLALEIALSMLTGEDGMARRVLNLARCLELDEQRIGNTLSDLEQLLRCDLPQHATESFAIGEAEYEDTLCTLVGLDLTAEATWQQGWTLYQEATETLAAVTARLGRGLSVAEVEQQLGAAFHPPADLLTLYAQAWRDARDFIRQHQLLTLPDDAYTIDVVGTSGAWKAIKSTAGYNCPRGQTRATLHVNLDDPSRHVDYLNTIAHELYPGHHMQGLIARQNPRSLRQQFEVPIFYEGWASYCERLVIEQGFWSGDAAWFFFWKRRIFLAARVLADVGLHTGRLTLEQASQLLTQAHMPARLAMHEARRYTLNPAYPISYALGASQLESLCARFAPRLGLGRFHDVVLAGGDMPWRWVEARLEEAK
jgi:uncharacterized protein (DUF885 family)